MSGIELSQFHWEKVLGRMWEGDKGASPPTVHENITAGFCTAALLAAPELQGLVLCSSEAES